MENYQQKIDDLLRKARAQGAARAARTNKPFITNIVVAPKDEKKPKEELKSLKDIWRSMDTFDSKDTTPATKFRKAGKSTKGKKQKKTTKQSSSNKNHRADWQPDLQPYRANMENIPVQPFVGFRRNKRTPQSTKKYASPIDSPGSDQSSDSSPLKNARKPAITNYFQRMGIKIVHPAVYSPDTVHSDTIRSDTISPEIENTMDFSSSFSEDSSFVTISSDEDVLMASAASTPDKHMSGVEEMMIFSDSSSPEVMSAKKGKTSVFKVAKNATTTRIRLPFSPKVTLDQTPEQTPDHGITPPNRNALVGYFQKGKRQQKSSEFVTGDKLNNASPDTLRILAAAQSNGEFGLEEFKLPNPFI